MKNQILLLIVLTILIQSCKTGTTTTTSNDDIPDHIKNEINELDHKFLKAISEKDIVTFKAIASESLLEKNRDNLDRMIQQLSERIKTSEYRTIDQYHVQNSTSGLANTVMSEISGAKDYIIEFLCTNIYGKYPDGWRLNIAHIGDYTVNGKNAPQLYQQAKKEYEKGFLMDAVNNMFLNSGVISPGGKVLKYQKEDEMKAFYERILQELNETFNFPMTISEIDSNPQILNIYPKETDEGYFPMVEYFTKIDLKDTVRTKIENSAIHELIGDKFKGLNEDKKYVFYTALNGIPDGKTLVSVYRFIQENN